MFKTRESVDLRKGFSLIEMLVVTGVLAVVAAVGSIMFLGILRGANKTKIMTEVKQNGEYVLSVMERTIRDGRVVTATAYSPTPTTEIRVISADGTTQNIFACDPLVLRITMNGNPLTSDLLKLDSCNIFTVTQGATNQPDQVAIDFTLSQAAVSTRPEDIASAKFKTTVTLRNY